MRRRRGVVTATAMAVVVTVGYFKPALSFLPVDATLVAASVVAMLCLSRLLMAGSRIPVATVVVLGLFAVLAVPCALASFDSYSTSKVLRLFSLTLVAALAPTVLMRRQHNVALFLHAVTAIGVLVALESLWFPSETDRLVAAGVDTISLGRATGLPAVWVVLLALQRRLLLGVAAVLLVPLLMSLVGSGSRGPLLAVSVSLAVTLALSRRHRRPRAVAVWAAVIAGGIYAFVSASVTSTDRLARLGEDRVRRASFRETLTVIAENPLGVGWGDWADHVDLFASEVLKYPHNVLLEVSAEGGWLVGIVVVAVLWMAFRCARRLAAMSVEGQGVLATLVFAFMNAMVSGDINGNRLLWVAVGLSFALDVWRPSHPARQPVPAVPVSLR